jgi:hypothetical protein
MDCYKDWLLNTEEGRRKLKKSALHAHKEVQKEEKQKDKEKKIDLMSKDKYRALYVQPIINEIARLIDYGQPCIATGLFSGKMNGGHFHAVGSNRTIALNLHNIHIQSFHSNHFKSGDNTKYREGLKRVYGQEYLDLVESLNSIPAIHLSLSDLKEIKNHAIIIRKELRESPVVLTPWERIELRDTINFRLGIY